jgi:hypothetical protein
MEKNIVYGKIKLQTEHTTCTFVRHREKGLAAINRKLCVCFIWAPNWIVKLSSNVWSTNEDMLGEVIRLVLPLDVASDPSLQNLFFFPKLTPFFAS